MGRGGEDPIIEAANLNKRKLSIGFGHHSDRGTSV